MIALANGLRLNEEIICDHAVTPFGVQNANDRCMTHLAATWIVPSLSVAIFSLLGLCN